MIDTDKYEGHTPGPWTPNDDGYVDADYNIAQVLPFVSPKAFLANTQLIADAPLLLEEVKRLRDLLEAYGIQSDGYTIPFDPKSDIEDATILAEWAEATTQGYWGSVYEYKVMKQEESE